MTATTTTAAEESEELARFRQQWFEELRAKKKVPTSEEVAGRAPSSSTSTDLPGHPHPRPHLSQRRASHDASSPPPVARKPTPRATPAPMGPALQRAVEVYRKAILHEQRSELDDALRLYRTAFRMDPNVDRAYHLMEDEQQRRATMAPVPAHKVHHHKSASSGGAVDHLAHELEGVELGPARIPVAHARGDGFVTGTLAGLVASWSDGLSFEPENEQEGIPIKTMPDEMLLLVLRLLDHTSVERFARVNRKARVLTLDASLWRPIAKTIYQPPQVSDDEDFEALVLKYMTDYRRLYIEHPRVRYDGVYIAVCHYMRNGVGENVWVNYSHLITYYRYLRFYPDGQVISLLANEELAPSHVIPILKPTLRMKGFFIGNWYLDGTEVHIDDLLDPGMDGTRYSFQMVLELRSRPLGRWNRLDFRGYDSVHIATGEATPLALKNERPFWFSKVRSYA
ncbi:hypothetical protein C8T65DRAFT_206191 [Cerioporus squamosus]|nr:hypothetical protein C8T65DRAFT_206191 [Cerioporus squamosus]